MFMWRKVGPARWLTLPLQKDNVPSYYIFVSFVNGSSHFGRKYVKGLIGGRGGGYCHIWVIWVCAALKEMVFE